MVPRSSRGGGIFPSSKNQMSNQKQSINIAIIGAGFARTVQIPGFLNWEGARVVAIASKHKSNAEKVAHEFGIEHFTDDWREIIKRDEVDLVSIVTPPVTHCEMTLAALDADKAVLCEKPTAMNADEALAMWDKAKEKNALALIDHELRFLNGRLKAREMISNGTIGEIRHAKLLFRTDSRASDERGWNWWSDEKQGGGALGAIGSHAVDGFRWLLKTEVEEVFCSLNTYTKERKDTETGELKKVTTDDEANLILRFADNELMKGATAAISLSMIESGKAEHRLEVFGSKGALMIEEGGQLFHSQTGEGAWREIEIERGELAKGMLDKGWTKGFTAFSKRIITALQAGEKTVEGSATFEDGYRAQLVLDAARRSNENRCVVKL